MYSATKQEGGVGGSAECEQMEYEIRRDNDHNGKADNIFPTNPSMIPASQGRRVPGTHRNTDLYEENVSEKGEAAAACIVQLPVVWAGAGCLGNLRINNNLYPATAFSAQIQTIQSIHHAAVIFHVKWSVVCSELS